MAQARVGPTPDPPGRARRYGLQQPQVRGRWFEATQETSMSSHVHGVAASQDDIDAITRFVAEVQRTQQNELAEAFLRPFREDAVWVTGHGRLLDGRDQISAFTHRVLPGSQQESMATYEVVRILFIRPDVAAVNVRQRPVTRDGRPLDAPSGSPLYVLAKEGGQWRLAAAQNTIIVDPDTLAAS
jgi:uncharacterized protein (TIGR02246 family)